MFLTTQGGYFSYYTGRLCFFLHREVMFLTTQGGYVSYYRGRLCFYLGLYCHPLPDSSFKLVIVRMRSFSQCTSDTAFSFAIMFGALFLSLCEFPIFLEYFTMAVTVTLHVVHGLRTRTSRMHVRNVTTLATLPVKSYIFVTKNSSLI